VQLTSYLPGEGLKSMFPYRRIKKWTTGTFTASTTYPLDPARRHVVTGGLIAKQGGSYGHVYISAVCRLSSPDLLLCGIREGDVKNLNLGRFSR
jgi:hypothetical protein